MNLVHSPFLQLVGDELGSPGFLESQLRMSVDVVADSRQFIGEFLDTRQDGHLVFLCLLGR